jgi:hypothetical protein
MKPERLSGMFSMIKIYPVDVRIGNVENGISKLSSTKIVTGFPARLIECRLKDVMACFPSMQKVGWFLQR